MSEWAAEILVDERLARQLLATEFPDLPARSLVSLGEGWDYAVFLVDDEWVFRFPRREVVVPGTEREIAVLPLLDVPIAIPRPEHVGAPSDAFPWPFYGARYIPGAEATGVSDATRQSLARPLARFLRALHAHALDLPVDPQRRSDMSFRVPRVRGALAAIGDLWSAPPAAGELLAQALELAPPEPRVLCHGDLHFRQLLVDGNDLTGIVDWVDVCRSDPGVDLSLAYGFLPPAARAEFFDEYGEVEPASLLRARVLALNLMAILARYGRDEGKADVEAEALAGLECVFA